METRLLRMPEVVRITGLRPSTIYKLIRSAEFPRSIKLTKKTTAWDSRLVESWVKEKVSQVHKNISITKRAKGWREDPILARVESVSKEDGDEL